MRLVGLPSCQKRSLHFRFHFPTNLSLLSPSHSLLACSTFPLFPPLPPHHLHLSPHHLTEHVHLQLHLPFALLLTPLPPAVYLLPAAVVPPLSLFDLGSGFTLPGEGALGLYLGRGFDCRLVHPAKPLFYREALLGQGDLSFAKKNMLTPRGGVIIALLTGLS